jgi:hypothetical protein
MEVTQEDAMEEVKAMNIDEVKRPVFIHLNFVISILTLK